jgi:two-component system, sensor histidine kinase and response regulator
MSQATPSPAEDVGSTGDLIDGQHLREVVGGDPDLLQVLLDAFLAEAPQQLAAVRQALQAGDAPTLRRAAHTLKGSAGYFGARPVIEAAYQLERISAAAAEGQTLDAARPLVDQLSELVPKLISRVAELVRQSPAAGAGSVERDK